MDDSPLVRVMLGRDEYRMVRPEDVPPGYVPITVVGVGRCYVGPEVLSEMEQSDHRHPPFLPAARAILAEIAEALRDVRPLPVEEWEEGFRRDAHPWREMALFCTAADALNRFTAHLPDSDPASVEKKRDIFAAVMAFVNYGGQVERKRPVSHMCSGIACRTDGRQDVGRLRARRGVRPGRPASTASTTASRP